MHANCSSTAAGLPRCWPPPRSDGCFISKGYDATTHFETTVEDVLQMYQRITGTALDLDAKNPRLQQQQEA